MDCILKNHKLTVNHIDYYIYLHSNHVIIHLRVEGEHIAFYQASINNTVDWITLDYNKGFPLPIEVMNFCDRVVKNKIFW